MAAQTELHTTGCHRILVTLGLPGLWLGLVAITLAGTSPGAPGDVFRTLWRALLDGAPQACSIPLPLKL